MEKDYMSLEEWKTGNPYYPHMPVILNEGLAKMWHKKGLITDKQIELLEKDNVVLIANHWVVMSKNLVATPNPLK